jgi:hypothetical protein
MPILTLSIGETCSEPLGGTFTVSTGVAEESVFIGAMLDESVVVVVGVMALSACWLCVTVGAGAPVPI